MPAAFKAPSNFVDFPHRDVILAKIRDMEGYEAAFDGVARHIADRLDSRTYDRSAFVFILIELIYEFEDEVGSDYTYLLPRTVLALTADRQLARSASDAFQEIKDAIEPVSSADDEPAAGGQEEDEGAPAGLPEIDEDGDPQLIDSPEETVEIELGDDPLAEIFDGEVPVPREKPDPRMDGLMSQLQWAQKELADLGLGTRVSIEMAVSRPNRSNVGRTIREIDSLRTILRQFDELLSEAEKRILEAAGVLEKGDSE